MPHPKLPKLLLVSHLSLLDEEKVEVERKIEREDKVERKIEREVEDER